MQCVTRASSVRSIFMTFTGRLVAAEKQKEYNLTNKTLKDNSLTSINEIKLLGRVSSEPIKEKTDTFPIVHFMLATKNHYIDSEGERQMKVDKNKICVYDTALGNEVFESVKRGVRVYITGTISDANTQLSDGQIDTETIVVAENVTCLKY